MQRVRTPPPLHPRPRDAHKASVGRVLVIGGHRDMCGAPALAALGALRAGAGLVRIAVGRSIQPVVATLRAEATTAGLPDTDDGALAPDAVEAALALVASWDTVVLGPGAGRDEATLEVLRTLALFVEIPLVLDADALFAFAGEPATLQDRSGPLVITPHEGEAARLLGRTSRDVKAERMASALELARACGGVVVLKGPGTLVTDGERLYQERAGGPWLATGGSGDVLAGVIGAFVAGLPETGGDLFGAAVLGVHVHAHAADGLAAEGVDRGLLASDIAHALPAALAAQLQGESPGNPA